MKKSGTFTKKLYRPSGIKGFKSPKKVVGFDFKISGDPIRKLAKNIEYKPSNSGKKVESFFDMICSVIKFFHVLSGGK